MASRPKQDPTPDPLEKFVKAARELGLEGDDLTQVLENVRAVKRTASVKSVMAEVVPIMSRSAPYGRYSIVVAAPENDGEDASVAWTYGNTLAPMTRKGTGGKRLDAIKVTSALKPEYQQCVGLTYNRNGDAHPAIEVLRVVEPALADTIGNDAGKLHNLVNYVKSRFTYEAA